MTDIHCKCMNYLRESWQLDLQTGEGGGGRGRGSAGSVHDDFACEGRSMVQGNQSNVVLFLPVIPSKITSCGPLLCVPLILLLCLKSGIGHWEYACCPVILDLRSFSCKVENHRTAHMLHFGQDCGQDCGPDIPSSDTTGNLHLHECVYQRTRR